MRAPTIFLIILALSTQTFGQVSPTVQESEPLVVLAESPDLLGDQKTILPVDKIPAKQLRAQERSSLAGLNSIAGVQFRENGSPSVSFHGSLNSARVLTVLEGVPLNFSDGAGLYSSLIPTELLDTVKVYRTSASTPYGQDSLGGALEFKLEKLKKTRLRATSGSFGRRSLFAGVPLLKKDQSFYQVTAFRETDDGFRPRSDKETTRAAFLGYTKTEALEIQPFFLVSQQIGSTPADKYNLATAEAFRSLGQVSSLNVRFSPNERWQLQNRVSYKIMKLDYTSGDSQRLALSDEASVEHKFDFALTKFFGSFVHDSLSSPFLPSGSTVARDQFYLGGSAQFPTSEKSYLQISSTYFPSENQAVLGAGGATELESGWTTFAGYSEGLHVPSIFQKNTSTAFIIGNPNLHSEKSTQIDVGFLRAFDDSRIVFSAFQRDTRDLIVTQNQGGVYRYENIQKALAYGFDIAFDKQWDQYELRSNMSYLENRAQGMDRALPLSPQTQFFTQLSKNFGNLSAGISETFWARFFNNASSTNEQRSFLITDLFSTYQLSDSLKTQFSVTNLFDSPIEFTNGYPEPSREFTLSLQGEF